jgi:hypothetical protein
MACLAVAAAAGALASGGAASAAGGSSAAPAASAPPPVTLDVPLKVRGSVGGTVLDARNHRVFHLQAGAAAAVTDMSTGIVDTIPTIAGETVSYGFVSPHGAIFVTAYPGANVYEWRDGVLVNLGYSNSSQSLADDGSFAIWSNGLSLYRRDLDAGVTTLVSTTASNGSNSILANGDVVYASSTSPTQIFRWSNGVQVKLSSDPTMSYFWPAADDSSGNVVAVRRTPAGPNQEIVLITPSGETPLRSAESNIGAFFGSGGYAAWTSDSGLWRRDPLGNVTFIAATGQLVGLSPTGEVAYAVGRQVSFPGDIAPELRLLTPAGDQLVVDVTVGEWGHSLGWIKYFNSSWVLALGNAVLVPGTPATASGLSVSSPTVYEGSRWNGLPTSPSEAVFTVFIPRPRATALIVAYAAVRPGGPTTLSSPFLQTSGAVTIPAGKVAAQVAVPILDLTMSPTPPKDFYLRLLGVERVPNQPVLGTGTVVDDDFGPIGPQLSIGSMTVVEGNAGAPRQLLLTVSVQTKPLAPVSFHFATVDGTATAGTDYAAVAGTRTIPKGGHFVTIAVSIKPDTLIEGDEAFSVVLSAPVNAVIAAPTGDVVITNDD